MEPAEEKLMRQEFQLENAEPAKGRKFNANVFQGILMGLVMTLSMNEVAAQLLLQISADAGELPKYINDVFFVALSLVESAAAPFVCWLGYRREKFVFMVWIFLTVATTVPLFGVPFPPVDSTNADLCGQRATPAPDRMTAKAIARVAIVMAMAIVAALGRLSIWAHGVAYLDGFRPECIVKDLGIFITGRVCVLVLGKDAMMDLLQHRLWLQVLMQILPLVIKGGLVFSLFPAELPLSEEEKEMPVQDEGRGFFQTLKRIYSNKTVMLHCVSAAILAAGVWGFALHNTDIIKTKYQLVIGPSMANNIADMQRTIAIVLVVFMVANELSTTSSRAFDMSAAVRKTVVTSAAAALLVVVMGALACDVTRAAGGQYAQPQCSLRCGCDPRYDSFQPICMLNEMKTYYSACHAGCRTRTDLNGTMIVTNCACAQGNAIAGACGEPCHGTYSLHQIAFVGLLMCTVVALTLHAMLVLRSVLPRDKATSLGVVFSLVALISSAGGHAAFRGVADAMCVFKQQDRCELFSERFPLAMGSVSAGVIVISLVINVISCIMMRRR